MTPIEVFTMSCTSLVSKFHFKQTYSSLNTQASLFLVTIHHLSLKYYIWDASVNFVKSIKTVLPIYVNVACVSATEETTVVMLRKKELGRHLLK